jgi:hypothetical protein
MWPKNFASQSSKLSIFTPIPLNNSQIHTWQQIIRDFYVEKTSSAFPRMSLMGRISTPMLSASGSAFSKGDPHIPVPVPVEKYPQLLIKVL